MSNLIDRRVAINAVEESRRLNHHQDGKESCAHEYEHRHFLKILNDLPDAQRWIPCSERMPEGGRQVLVYARSVHFALAKYDEMREADGTYKKQWVTFDAWKPFYKIKEVIAWMPLPEPYIQ